jgi:hypothetical protein
MREEASRVGVDLALGEVHESEILLLGDDAGYLALLEQAFVDEDLAEALAGLDGLAERVLELLGREESFAEDQRPERRVRPLPMGPGSPAISVHGLQLFLLR